MRCTCLPTVRDMSALGRGVRRLPLRGADLVLMARHPRWKGSGLNKNTLLVIECDGPIDSQQITRALDRLLDVLPVAGRSPPSVRSRGAGFTGPLVRVRR